MGARRGQKRVLGLLELKLQAVGRHQTWVLVTELQSSEKAANVLNF